MEERTDNIRRVTVRCLAMFLSMLLGMMPLMANSRSMLIMMDDYGTVPAPLAEEEEVKHACSISWCTILDPTDDHLLRQPAPLIADPYSEVEHFEVDVPPPKY